VNYDARRLGVSIGKVDDKVLDKTLGEVAVLLLAQMVLVAVMSAVW
jgi:hypothetical protein